MSEQDVGRLDQASDFTTHATTYHRFMVGVKWALIHLAAVISFLTVWFAANAGFIAGLAVGLVVFFAGVYAMQHGLAHSSEDGSSPHPAAH